MRLPWVAAAIPLFVTASANIFDDINREAAGNAAVVLAVSTGVTYLVIVWPSVRLGFRVKRAIFRGGIDFAHPLRSEPGVARWQGVETRAARAPLGTASDQPSGDTLAGNRAAERPGGPTVPAVDADRHEETAWHELRCAFKRLLGRTDQASKGAAPQPSTPARGKETVEVCGGLLCLAAWQELLRAFKRLLRRNRVDFSRRSFPAINAYRDEEAVFDYLGHTKHREAAVDRYLSPGPYLVSVVALGFAIGWAIATFVSSTHKLEGLALAPFAVLSVFLVVAIQLQGRRNVQGRRRDDAEADPGCTSAPQQQSRIHDPTVTQPN